MPWWMNAEEINRQHVRLPYALRDAFRSSHFAREETARGGPRRQDTWTSWNRTH